MGNFCVSLDTSVLSLYIRDARNKEEEKRKKKAETIINEIIEKKYKIVLPTIVYCEILSTLPEEEKERLNELITEHIEFASFCVRSATFCANHFECLKHKQNGEENYYRKVFRVDTMILATSIVNDIPVLYVDDIHFKKMNDSIESETVIKTLDDYVIDSNNGQLSLFHN